jgi:hypothetical protein
MMISSKRNDQIADLFFLSRVFSDTLPKPFLPSIGSSLCFLFAESYKSFFYEKSRSSVFIKPEVDWESFSLENFLNWNVGEAANLVC